MKISPKFLSGKACVEPSKSIAHRMLIAAALSEGVSKITPISKNHDVLATIKALLALGICKIAIEDKTAIVVGKTYTRLQNNVDCNQSGSTLRFLIPIAAAHSGAVFETRGRLSQRPMMPFADVFEKSGVAFYQNGTKMTVSGGLKPDTYVLPGDVSSQFFTGLLFALPLLKGDSQLLFSTPPQSLPYIELTLSILKKFGVDATYTSKGLEIKGNQEYLSGKHTVSGDWSHAAFFVAFGALGGNICISGLDRDDVQGDKEILCIAQKMGAQIEWIGENLFVTGGELTPVHVDASQIPDLVPAICAMACGAKGVSRISNAGRLRHKESDRIAAIVDALGSLGAAIDCEGDDIVIQGNGKLTGGSADSHNDHRIAMMIACASCICSDVVNISAHESVAKSAPSFWDDFLSLGGKIIGK